MRIQKRAVGILENSQTKSAIAVEKDTVPLAFRALAENLVVNGDV